MEIEKPEEQENTGINFDAYEDIPVDTSGENVPPPVNTFAEIDLGMPSTRILRDASMLGRLLYSGMRYLFLLLDGILWPVRKRVLGRLLHFVSQ